MTAAALLREAAAALEAAGVPAPEWDAERLLRHVTGQDRAALVASPDAPVAGDAAALFRSLVARRAARVPLQHIVGTQAFWRHDFLVTPDVLVPRPETEVLVEAALERLRGVARPVVVDIGAGSGCIALSLAAEREDAEVHAVDLSEPALAVARENARRLGLGDRVVFHHGDLLAPLAALRGRVDLVVSNPPYVDAADRDTLAPEVRDHEPALALFPPGDALLFYRRLAAEAPALLRSGGWLAVEVGSGQAAAVAALFERAGLAAAPPTADLAGIPRVVAATRALEGAAPESPGGHRRALVPARARRRAHGRAVP